VHFHSALRDPEYRGTAVAAPINLLLYARAMHHFPQRLDVVSDIISDRITSMDSMDPFGRELGA
jgi:hypothetical protein